MGRSDGYAVDYPCRRHVLSETPYFSAGDRCVYPYRVPVGRFVTSAKIAPVISKIGVSVQTVNFIVSATDIMVELLTLNIFAHCRTCFR